MPCPFNITECREGVTFSLWFRGEKTTSNMYKNYIMISNVFNMYRLPMQSIMDFAWYSHKGEYCWNRVSFPDNQWVHVALIWDTTHTISYINGEKNMKKAMVSQSGSVVIGHEIRFVDPRPGNYSVSGLSFWSGRASPVFIWRLYQEGLPSSSVNEWWLYC